MEKLRIGIIGAGNIAQNAHLPVYKERDDVQVVNDDTVLFPGDKAVIVADNEVLNEVRLVFKSL